MPQNRQTGTDANDFGREFARRLAGKLGAEMLDPNSNECKWNDENVLIKSGHAKTQSVGISYRTAPRVKAVLGAFEHTDGSYRIFRLPIERCQSLMKANPTHSQGSAAGKVGMVPRRVFESEGKLVGIVSIDEP